MNVVQTARVDRSALEIASLEEHESERRYWRAKSTQERMQALELMRQIIYGYDPATTRLQGFFEVAQLS